MGAPSIANAIRHIQDKDQSPFSSARIAGVSRTAAIPAACQNSAGETPALPKAMTYLQSPAISRLPVRAGDRE